MIALRFTRALFGLAPSPFLLGGVIDHHLKAWSHKVPQSVAEILRSLYVDDLISGNATITKAKELKSDAVEIFSDAGFHLHKWHSNAPELEESLLENVKETEDTYAKQNLNGESSGGGTKLLGLEWDKSEDTLAITFPQEDTNPTKRATLGKLTRIYDPLGLTSPTTLQGKLIYRDYCTLKLAWDAPLPHELAARWTRWESSLAVNIVVKRALAPYQEPINEVELHAFGDASGCGVATAVYTVVRQDSGTTQGLVAAKARLAKQRLTIPRLELVAGHMAANSVDNIRRALDGFPIVSVYCWLDSTVALHWIRGSGEYRQFVANRARKIKEHRINEWRHVPSDQNPADLGSRGGSVVASTLWWNGPGWLQDRSEWPSNPVTTASVESAAESKIMREVLAAVTLEQKPD